MRIGLIGYGAWGFQHAAAIARLPGLELAAIATRGEASRAAAASAHPGVAVVEDYRDLLARDDIPMLDIVSPNHVHGEMAEAALIAGKHVLLEKPMGISAAECDRLVAAEAAATGRLSIGHELRLSSQWGRVRDDIAAGRIGEPRHVSIGLFRNPYRPGADGWRIDPARVGSWSLEETVHFFDLALWYLGHPGASAAVTAIGSPAADHPDLYETLCTHIRIDDGTTVAINHTTAGFGHQQWAEVVGTEGAIRTAWQGQMDRDEHPQFDYRIRPKGFAFERGVNEFEEVPLAASSELVELERQLALTAKAFARGETLVRAEDGRAAVVLCLAAEEAARTGKAVTVAL